MKKSRWEAAISQTKRLWHLIRSRENRVLARVVAADGAHCALGRPFTWEA